jgi:predicted helicase
LDDRTYDGFRKLVSQDFSEIWVIDLKGNARTSGERRRMEGGNIFEDQIRVGIAIYFCVKSQKAKGCHIRYQAVNDYATSDEKIDFLGNAIAERQFEFIRPDRNHNWINLADTDFDTLLPIANKQTKSAKRAEEECAIFKMFSLGIVTNRDEWIVGATSEDVTKKVRFFVDYYNHERTRLATHLRDKNLDDLLSPTIKWTRAVKRDFKHNISYKFQPDMTLECMYRPYTLRALYYDRHLIEMLNQTPIFFGPTTEDNVAIDFRTGKRAEFAAVAVTKIPTVDIFTPSAGQFVGRWRYVKGVKIDNITDWGLTQFRAKYGEGSEGPPTKDAIFHYVYAILHDPIYREKYELNLKREFPSIPFYSNFWRWAGWGEKLTALHTGYEAAEPWPLERIDTLDGKSSKTGRTPKPMLKPNKEAGNIQLDSETQLTGVPPPAWRYRLGNRSALEWILDQYKKKTPRDPTIREKFNTYRFADHKEKVIDLLRRVTRVSVETMQIVDAMRAEKR